MRVIPEATRVMRCRPCAHRTRAGSCGQPVQAGLADAFAVVWPDPGFECRNFERRPDAMPEPDPRRLEQQYRGVHR